MLLVVITAKYYIIARDGRNCACDHSYGKLNVIFIKLL